MTRRGGFSSKVAIGVMVAAGVAGIADPRPATVLDEVAAEVRLPPGLVDFITARELEAGGRYRDAIDAYERALREAGDVTEIRVSYASLLVELGMAQRAVEVLETADGLDWYGLRVRALALARTSSRQPELLEKAEVALRAALGERGDDPSLLLALAQVLERRDRPSEAEQVVAQLRQSRGSSAQLTAYHARLLRAAGRSEQAVELYAECAAADSPSSLECREALVELLVELGRPGDAGEVMLAWLTDDDLDELLRAASLLYEGTRWEDALRVVGRVLRRAPESPPARTLEAMLLSNMGRYEEATERLRALARSDRDNLDVMLALAWALANTNQHDEAREWVDRAWRTVSGGSDALRSSRVALAAARVELVGDHPAAAREWLDRVSALDRLGGPVVGLLASSYRRDEHWSEGTAAMLRLQPRLGEPARRQARAVEAEFRLRVGDERGWRLLRPLLDSTDPAEVGNALGVLQALGRWQDVDREAAAALERVGGDRDLSFLRAAALERLGRFDEAEQLFVTLVSSDPDDAAAANYLGYAWADRGENLERALELIQRAVELDPDNPAYLDSLGWVHFRRGDIEEAEYWLQRAVALGGRDGTILAHLGEVLLARGIVSDARRLLQQALGAGCDDPDRVRAMLADIADSE